ncbi:MAG: TolC family protein [Pseudomonadales bacterium]
MTAVGFAAPWALADNAPNRELPALIERTLASHPGIRVQQSLARAADAQVDAARRQFFPNPSINYERVETSERDSVYRGNDQITVVRLQQSLWTGGRLRGGLARARSSQAVARAEINALRLQLALQVAGLWAEAHAAQAVAEAYLQSRDVHERLRAMVERRVAGGASAEADAELARARLQQVEADLAGAIARRDAALERIRTVTEATDFAPGTGPVGRYRTTFRPTDPDLMVASAMENSPFVERARLQVELSQADVKVARAALSPEIFLRAESQRGSFEANDETTRNRLVLGVSSNLGPGLSALAGVDEARARLEAAQEEVASEEMNTAEQVRSDLVLLNSAQARQELLALSRRSADAVLGSSERLFVAGRRPWQDIMNAARDVAQADAQAAEAAGTDLVAGWRLALVVQGLTSVLANTSSLPVANENSSESP